MVNGYGIPLVIYEPFNFFAATDLPTTGREITCSMPDANWYLANAYIFYNVAGGAAATFKIRKITDNSAPNAGAGATVIELTGAAGASTQDLTLAARVWREIPLIKNVSARTFKAFQRLVAVTGGTVAPLADVVLVFKWVRI